MEGDIVLLVFVGDVTWSDLGNGQAPEGFPGLVITYSRSSLEKMIRVAAVRQWSGIIRELHGSSSPITPLFLQQFSTTSQSKTAYTGSEILNYMGGLDGDEKQLIHKLVNFRMKEGKKTRVRAIFHETLHKLARTDRDAVKLISEALENVKPICEVAKLKNDELIIAQDWRNVCLLR
ncbi:unnamed protein product [Lactuca saligna]|uniref:Small ribosomal subunit protein uS7 domain-containing protein n=1 Tax=Lactuca saligna TaxID=75948 RepID=A0AA35YY14_LACSI|nr:unnamed protein product [Lactuca saligna]